MYLCVLLSLAAKKKKNARFAVAKRIAFFLPEKDYAGGIASAAGEISGKSPKPLAE